MVDERKIVFFDGVCNFCNGSVDFIWRNNPTRNIYYCPLQSEFAQKFLMQFDEEIKLNTIYFYKEGKIYKKSKAVFLICFELKVPYRLLGRLLIRFTWFGDIAYDLIAKNRYKILGKKDSCRLPSKDEERYFL